MIVTIGGRSTCDRPSALSPVAPSSSSCSSWISSSKETITASKPICSASSTATSGSRMWFTVAITPRSNSALSRSFALTPIFSARSRTCRPSETVRVRRGPSSAGFSASRSCCRSRRVRRSTEGGADGGASSGGSGCAGGAVAAAGDVAGPRAGAAAGASVGGAWGVAAGVSRLSGVGVRAALAASSAAISLAAISSGVGGFGFDSVGVRVRIVCLWTTCRRRFGRIGPVGGLRLEIGRRRGAAGGAARSRRMTSRWGPAIFLPSSRALMMSVSIIASSPSTRTPIDRNLNSRSCSATFIRLARSWSRIFAMESSVPLASCRLRRP